MTVGFQALGLGVVRCFLSALKPGTEPWKPGPLEPDVGCKAGLILPYLENCLCCVNSNLAVETVRSRPNLSDSLDSRAEHVRGRCLCLCQGRSAETSQQASNLLSALAEDKRKAAMCSWELLVARKYLRTTQAHNANCSQCFYAPGPDACYQVQEAGMFRVFLIALQEL